MKPGAFRGVDWYLVGSPLLLFSIGLSVIYSLAVVREAPSLVTSQSVAAVIGVIVAAYLGYRDYRRLVGMMPVFYVLGILLLIGVLFFGDTVLGAKRWISFGPFQLQPSELMKLGLIGMLASQLYQLRDYPLRKMMLIIGLIALPVSIVLFQPDLGTAATLGASTVIILLVAQLPRRYWVVLGVALAVTVPLVFFNLADYQRERIQTFLRPTSDPYGSGYNVLQSIIAVGNGGLRGQGIGQGTQSQLEFLPIAHTDFIFAGIAEATGFIGSTVVLLLLAILVIRAVLIGQRAPDQFGFFMAMGIAGLWLIQFSVNIAMNIGLMPVTGIPLPFVSHGGTALVMNCAALGFLQSIARRSVQVRYASTH